MIKTVYRAHEDISKATYDRYKRQFEQCFEMFGKRKMRTVTEGKRGRFHSYFYS